MLAFIIHALEYLVDVDVAEVALQVLLQVCKDFLVPLRQETRSLTSDLPQSVVDLFTTDVVEGEVLWGGRAVWACETHFYKLSHLWSVGRKAVSRKDLEIFVHVRELLQVVNVILIGFNIKSEVHSCKFIKLAHVYVISKVISSKVSLLLAVLFYPFEELIELLLALKDINLFRLDIFSLSFFQILSGFPSIFTEVSKGLLLKSPFLFDLNHAFLKLLTEEEISIIAFGSCLRIELHAVFLLRLLIQSG